MTKSMPDDLDKSKCCGAKLKHNYNDVFYCVECGIDYNLDEIRGDFGKSTDDLEFMALENHLIVLAENQDEAILRGDKKDSQMLWQDQMTAIKSFIRQKLQDQRLEFIEGKRCLNCGGPKEGELTDMCDKCLENG